jgi:hypothetical protein
LGAGDGARAAIVFVTDNIGNVWQYDSIADMAGQTATTNTGTMVRSAAAHGDSYKTDQDVTMALDTGLIYRIKGNGDVIRYPTVRDYLHDTNPTTFSTGKYVGNFAVNGLSYYFDGTNHRFYSILAGTTPSNPNGGDIAIYNNVSPRMRDASPNSFMTTANYTGAVLNFWDPDSTPGTTVGNPPTLAQKQINAHFYQVAGNGRLEGFESLADYNSSSNNRINITGLNAFGGTGNMKAIAAFAVPESLAVIPEASSVVIWLGILLGTTLLRRR